MTEPDKSKMQIPSGCNGSTTRAASDDPPSTSIRTEAFVALTAFCHHRRGCPQLRAAKKCTCGLGEAQEQMIEALYPVDVQGAGSPSVATDGIYGIYMRARRFVALEDVTHEDAREIVMLLLDADDALREQLSQAEKERDELKADSLLGSVSMSTCRSCGKEWPHPSVLSNFPTCGSCVWQLRQQQKELLEKLEGLRERWRARPQLSSHRCADELSALLVEEPLRTPTKIEKDKT